MVYTNCIIPVKDIPIHTIPRSGSSYPKLLASIPAPPEALYIQGNPDSLQGPCIALVGTRKASPRGRDLASRVAGACTKKGICVVSGLALGIDGAAHEGALEAGGRTVAVLGHGLDTLFPREHEELAQRILGQDGALISEYPPGTPVKPERFLERNRIISGLSVATVIIEAPLRSGTINTARHAAEQGRDVFVFPGAHDDPRYRGSHRLLRTGARLVSSPEEIFEDLGETPLFSSI